MVSGWRKDRKDPFLNRRLPSMLANWLISRITGVHLHDYGCTLKAYRREVIRNVHLYGEMHRFIPALASWVGGTGRRSAGPPSPAALRPVQVRHLAHVPGGAGPDHGEVPAPLQHRTRSRCSARSAALFAAPGVLMLLFMVLANLSYHVFGTTFAADLIKRPFWVMTAFMLIFFGMQFISMGLLAEIQIRTYHESQDQPIYFVRETRAPREG